MKLILIGEQFKLFDSVSLASTTNGTSFALPARATQLTYQTSFSSAPSSITANIQVSNDNLAWSTISTTTSTAGEAITFNSSAVFMRAQVSAISGGAGKTITLIIVAKTVSIGASTLAGLSDVDISGPINGQVLTYDSGTNKWINSASSGGSGTPGGSNTQVQFNDSGSFSGDSNFTWDNVVKLLTVNGSGIQATGVSVDGSVSAPSINTDTIQGYSGSSIQVNSWLFNGDDGSLSPTGGSFDLGTISSPVSTGYFSVLTRDDGDLIISTTTSGKIRLDSFSGEIDASGHYLTVDSISEVSSIGGPVATDMFVISQGSLNFQGLGGAVINLNSDGSLGLQSGVSSGEDVAVTSANDLILNAVNIVRLDSDTGVIDVTDNGLTWNPLSNPGSIQVTGGDLLITNAAASIIFSSVAGATFVEFANTVKFTIGSNHVEWDGSFLSVQGSVQAAYYSSDGTPGISAGPFTTITSITVKDGIVTDLQGS